MTTASGDVGTDGGDPAGLAQRLDELTDLFRRRLLEDRSHREQIAEQRGRIDALERQVALEHLRPIVLRIALVVDRIDATAGPDDQLARSAAEELVDALESVGVREILAEGLVDPMRHEIVRTVGEGAGELLVSEIVRRGYDAPGTVFRPSQVVATRAGDTGGTDALDATMP